MELSAVFSTSGMALFTIFLYLNRASLTAQRAFKIGIFCYLFLFISALGLFFFYFLRKTRRISFRGLLREIIPYWKGALPASIIPYFFGYGDRVIVSAMASASAVGFFHIPARILEYVKRLMAIPSEAALPEITHQWELRLRDTLGKDLEFFEKMYFIMGCAATILVILFRRELILLVSNPQFLKTEAILIIMALSLPPLSLIHPVTITARAIGKIRIGVISSLILVTVYLLSGGIFLAFGVGIMGMALAQCLAGVVGGSYIFIISRRFASLRWKVLKLFPIFLISVISFTISYLTKFLPFIPYFIKMFLCLVFCLLIFNFGIIKLKILSNKDIQNLKLIFKIPLTQRILQIFLNWPEKLFKKEPHLNF
jgi:O-antigen/teichoic acid export membrane protein